MPTTLPPISCTCCESVNSGCRLCTGNSGLVMVTIPPIPNVTHEGYIYDGGTLCGYNDCAVPVVSSWANDVAGTYAVPIDNSCEGTLVYPEGGGPGGSLDFQGDNDGYTPFLQARVELRSIEILGLGINPIVEIKIDYQVPEQVNCKAGAANIPASSSGLLFFTAGYVDSRMPPPGHPDYFTVFNQLSAEPCGKITYNFEPSAGANVVGGGSWNPSTEVENDCPSLDNTTNDRLGSAAQDMCECQHGFVTRRSKANIRFRMPETSVNSLMSGTTLETY